MLQYFVMGVVAYDWKHYLLVLKQIPLWFYCIAFSVIEVLPYIGGGGHFSLNSKYGYRFYIKSFI